MNQVSNEPPPKVSMTETNQLSTKQRRVKDVKVEDISGHPSLRCRKSEYHPNEQDRIRRAYLQKVLVSWLIISFHKLL